MRQNKNWLEELLGGVGQVAGGIAQTAWDNTPFGVTQKNLEQRNFKNDLMALQQLKNPQDQQMAFQELLNKYPDLLQIQNRMSSSAFTAPQERRTQEQWDLLDPQQKTQFSPRYGGSRTGTTDAEQRSARNKEAKQIEDLINTTTDEKIIKQLEKERAALFFEPEPEPYSDIGQGIGVPGTGTGVPARTEPRHTFSPDEYGGGKTQFSGQAAGQQGVDYRGYFSGGEDPFAEEQADYKSQGIAKSFGDIGIHSKDAQQQMNEIERMMPDVDVRGEYMKDPETYKRMFAAISAGELTTKEVVELIKQSLQ